MSFPSEKEFEEHFCKELEKEFPFSKMIYKKRDTANIDLDSLIDDEILKDFLETTQKEEIDELKIDLEDEWFSRIKEEVVKQLESKKLFEVLKEGVEVKGRTIKLVYFRPATSHNKEELMRYKSNVFSYVRQFAFKGGMESIDVVLFLNGFAIITVELKNLLTGQNVDDAVSQFIKRDKSLAVFRTPFLHLASDTFAAKIAAQFVENSADDFVHFNKDVENAGSIIENDFVVDYLYHDILRPESLLDIIESYLFCTTEKDKQGNKYRKYLFPRYHQRRTVNKVCQDLAKQFASKKELNKKYLIQHSPGSGKSFTIAVLQKALRNLHIENQKVFDSIIILTDRLNLDGQIKGNIEPGEPQRGVVEHAETTTELANYLNNNTKVIITTIQKFSVKKLDDLLTSQKSKRICFIIDEAHRSQAGKLHKHMIEKFDYIDDSLQEEIIEGIGKKNYPNAAFVALTATPSDKTLELFGKPFDYYTMDQAEKEGYILNVTDNIVTYSTLFKLSHEIDSNSEYPPMIVAKKIKAKAYETERIIGDKIKVILKIFEEKTKDKIGGKAKVMIVTSSRLAAVKYKLMLDEEIEKRKLPHKTLVAFSGSVLHQGRSHTENTLNKIEKRIEDQFKESEYKFIVVANKFQYGFNEPCLHTMFLDKAINGINAVQTISRLNRTLVGKTDTLVVDFTNSYKAIIAAFKKFKHVVNDYSGININELPLLYEEILKQNIFTKKDVDDFYNAITDAKNPSETSQILAKIQKKLNDEYNIQEIRDFRGLLNKFNDTFNYFDNLFKVTDAEVKKFSKFTFYLARLLDPIGKAGKLDEELKKVFLISHKIKKEKTKTIIDSLRTITKKQARKMHYVTIPEVVDAINTNYQLALGENDKGLFGEYIKSILHDSEILTAIKANKSNLEKLFDTTLNNTLRVKAIDYFIKNNPKELSNYLDTGVFDFINREAFNLAINKTGE
ncbi:MAG: DEAD/DEAH box helicase family protein [Clostridia bacterium]|nr:DEAD/DEAH box helicase family protein [Clostridia bacterium]